MTPALYRAFRRFDFALAALALVAFAIALAGGLGAGSVLLIAIAAFWTAMGVWMGRRADAGGG